jgi:hypothetical protein
MRAYVLVDSSYNKARELVNNLRNSEHILVADLINGPHSAIFVLEADESQDLAKTVLFKIGKHSDIRNMTVYLAQDEKKPWGNRWGTCNKSTGSNLELTRGRAD